tara:strand:- start:6146 stop:6319 length:174 start_codon:yes stop_codon:yes gene_type:complete
VNEDILIQENQKLSAELFKTQSKVNICLQALEAMMNYDHTGIIEKTLAELEKIDGYK